jgi:sporadic carbohydrate cluster protein (TIGR04323 family)
VSSKIGYRGYIASRAVRGQTTPQHVQNLVVRDYANRQKLPFKLSATEYGMPMCYMMLDSIVEELPTLEGIIVFSMFMLPQRAERRRALYRKILDSGSTLHAALESLALKNERDIQLFEDIFQVQQFTGESQMDLAAEDAAEGSGKMLQFGR